MKNILKELHEPCLNQYGFERVENVEGFNDIGMCYKVSSDIGKGYYWVYAKENLFSISIHDLVLYEDYFMKYQQPRYLSISYYDSVSGEELKPYKRINANCIRSRISENDLYQAIYHKSIPINSIDIDISPDYYEEYLNNKYPKGFQNSKNAFLSIDGLTDFPELVFSLRQIRNFKGCGDVAALYYESKVAEIISLIAEKNKSLNDLKTEKILSKQDIERLESARSYIDDHFAFEIYLEDLAKIAYMGTTKLKYSFKKAYHCTITEYIQNKRMAQAEHLLSNTDFTISQIAQIVGYNHFGRFSNLFKRSTGLLPSEYRKLVTKS
jgi:AraC-like DNA-binding protein